MESKPQGTPSFYMSISDVGRAFREGSMSSVSVTKQILDRINTYDGVLKSYALVKPENALASAKERDQEAKSGRLRGPLHGVPIAVKDIYDVAGWPTEVGMTTRRGLIADSNATVIHRLSDAGAVIVGKVHTTEGVYGEYVPPYTPPLNPWNHDHWSGVSSSGSAVATAAGLCFAALGSETGGSIRMPSASTGLTGIKPTWGRVSRAGVFELASTLDHVGVMCRSAVDAAMMLGAIAGPDENDVTAVQLPVPDYLRAIAQTQDLSNLRFGIDVRWSFEDTEPYVRAAIEEALKTLRELGSSVSEVAFPYSEDLLDDWYGVCGVETALAHAATYPRHKDQYSPGLGALLEHGLSLSGIDHQKLLRRRLEFRGQVDLFFRDIDVLISPTLPSVAPPVAEMHPMSEEVLSRMHRYTVPFTMSQHPVITMPAGFREGLPIGIQFVSKHYAEELLLTVASLFQSRTDWHLQHPALG